MTNYNDGNWHIWNGGECPVHPETVVEVALTDRAPCIEAAEQWFWGKDKSRIIAFRVIKEYKEPIEHWIWAARIYDCKESAYRAFDGQPDSPYRILSAPYKVREVLE